MGDSPSGRILIIGCSGFIGSYLAAALARENEVWGVARFSDPEAADRLRRQGVRLAQADLSSGSLPEDLPDRFDYVFSMAVVVAEADADPDLAFRVNGHLVAEVISRFRSSRAIVLGSTGSVYRPSAEPLEESSPLGPADAYGLSKVVGEEFGRYFSNKLRVPAVMLRYFHPYGPRGRFNRVLHYTRQIARGEGVCDQFGIDVFNPIHISDVIRMTLRAAVHARVPPAVINVGGGEVVNRATLARLIAEQLGQPYRLSPLPHDGPVWTCTGRLQEELLGKQEVDLRTGVAAVVDDFVRAREG